LAKDYGLSKKIMKVTAAKLLAGGQSRVKFGVGKLEL
jgi:hypothetical protein